MLRFVWLFLNLFFFFFPLCGWTQDLVHARRGLKQWAPLAVPVRTWLDSLSSPLDPALTFLTLLFTSRGWPWKTVHLGQVSLGVLLGSTSVEYCRRVESKQGGLCASKFSLLLHLPLRAGSPSNWLRLWPFRLMIDGGYPADLGWVPTPGQFPYLCTLFLFSYVLWVVHLFPAALGWYKSRKYTFYLKRNNLYSM